MAELVVSPSSSSAEVTPNTQNSDKDEPCTKKAKTEPVSSSSASSSCSARLEDRLQSILGCTVCLDSPTIAMYQCINGHLMCAACHAHLIADSRLRDEPATCPNCRCDIRENTCIRNRAVEKALSELPTFCTYCSAKFPRNQIENHQDNDCQKRETSCKYDRIGCSWRGPVFEMKSHESSCKFPDKPGSDIIDIMTALDGKRYAEMNLYRQIFELLSFQKIAQSDPQLRLWRTDDFYTKVFYESSSFSAFGVHWTLKACMTGEMKDPTLTSERSISYQLILKSETTAPLDIHYLVVKGPNSNYQIRPIIYRHEFNKECKQAPSQEMGVESSIECNKMLSQRALSLRIFMFQVPSKEKN